MQLNKQRRDSYKMEKTNDAVFKTTFGPEETPESVLSAFRNKRNNQQLIASHLKEQMDSKQ